jgi:hypothetical protein
VAKVSIVIFLLFPLFLNSSCIQDSYKKQIGVKELTGHNDGVEVEMYLHSVNAPKGSSWCAAFVHWNLNRCNIPNKVTAWSPTAHNPDNIVYFKSNYKKDPKAGDVFTLYSAQQRRIHHTGFFDKKINESIIQTVEGNTSGAGAITGSSQDVNGDGVYCKKRSLHSIYSITRWE